MTCGRLLVSVFPKPATINGWLSNCLVRKWGSIGKQIGRMKSVYGVDWARRTKAISLPCPLESAIYPSWTMVSTAGTSNGGSAHSPFKRNKKKHKFITRSMKNGTHRANNLHLHLHNRFASEDHALPNGHSQQ